jgi:hypothetical protein
MPLSHLAFGVENGRKTSTTDWGKEQMTMTTIAAIVYTILTGIIVSFQLGLAAGMPWGQAAMGGQYPGTFPPRLRIASLVQLVILIVLAAVVLIRADLILDGFRSPASWAIWIVVGFAAIATILNLITPSPLERKLWAPTSILLLATSLMVALL